MKSNNLILVFFLIFFIPKLSAQGALCECDNCPINMPNFATVDIDFYVNGITNNDLSNSNQGVCSINLDFEHQYVGDLLISLESPSGQIIDLVGAPGFFGQTDFSTYDISFIQCAQTPSNNAGINQWLNASMSAQNFDFVGSFWPVGLNANTSNTLNCLEDFNTGPVNGKWILRITDISNFDFGVLNSFQMEFCDEVGFLSCSSSPLDPCDGVNLILPTVQQDTNRAQISLESDANLQLNNVFFSAGDNIKLEPGFMVPVNTEFKAIIDDCAF